MNDLTWPAKVAREILDFGRFSISTLKTPGLKSLPVLASHRPNWPQIFLKRPTPVPSVPQDRGGNRLQEVVLKSNSIILTKRKAIWHRDELTGPHELASIHYYETISISRIP